MDQIRVHGTESLAWLTVGWGVTRITAPTPTPLLVTN